MSDTYSTYEAKARLSEILRKVENGQTITVSRRGQPIAEIRPIRRGPVNLEERIRDLSDRGALVPADGKGGLVPLAHRPGALARFLADRDS